MITLETVIALAIRDHTVMDELAEALRSELCIANPSYRRIIKFADDFLLQHRTTPAIGDWETWLETLDAGMQRDATREALGRLLALDLSAHTPAYFSPQALVQLQQAATQVAKARLNETPNVSLETFVHLAEELEHIRVGNIQGLAHLNDLETWARPVREEELIPTGIAPLDQAIGGWGQELWIVFADSGTGKSMFLQNCAANAARLGKRVLHVTLELGIRPQIHRYYRQLAQATRAEFATEINEVKRKLRHWFRFAKGEILLLEFPPFSQDPNGLKRLIERLTRSIGKIDILVLDYLDLLTLPHQVATRRGYEDLGRITHEVRGLCPTFDMTVLTASQAVRRPEKKGSLTVRDMGDSYNKVRAADGLLSLCQTDDEAEMHRGRLGVLKARDSGGRRQEFDLYINLDLALIQELNHPNTIELMRELHHLSEQQQAAAPPGGKTS